MTATPLFLNPPSNLAVDAATPVVLSFLAKNAAGAVVDIDTGYAAKLLVKSQSTPTSAAKEIDGTWVLGSAGTAVLTMTAAEAAEIPCGESLSYQVLISQDSFATASPIANGRLTSAQQII